MRIWNVLRMTVYGKGGFDVNWILPEIKAHANLKPQKIVVIAKYVRNFLTYFYLLTVVDTNYTSQGNEGNKCWNEKIPEMMNIAFGQGSFFDDFSELGHGLKQGWHPVKSTIILGKTSSESIFKFLPKVYSL